MKINVKSLEVKPEFHLTAKDLVPGTAYESEDGHTVIMMKIADPRYPHDYILRLDGDIQIGWANGFMKFRPLRNKQIILTTDNEGR